jgi:hypothetical protein
MNSDNDIDLEIALRTFHQLGLEGGDLGYEYWHAVGQLLKRAAGVHRPAQHEPRWARHLCLHA